jgi:hypothetical protein
MREGVVVGVNKRAKATCRFSQSVATTRLSLVRLQTEYKGDGMRSSLRTYNHKAEVDV